MTPPALHLQAIAKRFGPTQALDDNGGGGSGTDGTANGGVSPAAGGTGG